MKLFEELIWVIEKLRKECPWDRAQTHESLKKFLLEETYEVMEAIDQRDDKKLLEELGDLLLQPLFHTQIAKERGAFDHKELLENLIEKLINRHPHVFGKAKADEVLRNWERSKGRESILDGIPKNLPALLRSERIQDRASKVGFDFPSAGQALKKLDEEVEELKEAIREGEVSKIRHEVGDVLTAVVEVARLLGLSAEDCLQEANERFIRRFKRMEVMAKEKGKRLEEMSLKEMDELWEKAKELD